MDQKAPHLLVVDDEQDIVDFLKRCFEGEGYRVFAAAGGWEAQKLLADEAIDFVLTDMRMPRGDGVELLAHLEDKAGPKPSVAVMTAYADIQPAELFGRGACAFFEKPLDIDDLLARIKIYVTPVATRWALPPPGKLPAYHLNVSFDDYGVATRRGEVRLGRGGIFVATVGGQPKVGTTLAFTLSFGPRALTGQGRVAWTRSSARHGFHAGLGLEFLSLSPETLAFVVGELAVPPQAYIPLGLKPTILA